MRCFPVSGRINQVANDDEECCRPWKSPRFKVGCSSSGHAFLSDRSASSDDDRLPGVVDCERLRPTLPCHRQSVTVRELEGENPFNWIIELFDSLLQ